MEIESKFRWFLYTFVQWFLFCHFFVLFMLCPVLGSFFCWQCCSVLARSVYGVLGSVTYLSAKQVFLMADRLGGAALQTLREPLARRRAACDHWRPLVAAVGARHQRSGARSPRLYPTRCACITDAVGAVQHRLGARPTAL